MLKKLSVILVIILILCFIIFYVFDVKTIIIKNIYPQNYAEYVNKYSEEYDVDALLIFAMIKAESNFNPNAKSHNKAKGLMQLMEETALEISNDKDIDLYDPETNIKLGTYYFSTLLKKYNYQAGIALAAYNAGMGNVNTWIGKGTIKEDGSDLENIPYKETNMYVRKVLNDYKTYQKLYSEESI